MSAPQLEKAVSEEVAKAFDQPTQISELAGITIQATSYHGMTSAGAKVSKLLRQRVPLVLRDLITKVELARDCIRVKVSTAAIARCLGARLSDDAPQHVQLHVRAQLRRSGRVVRLIDLDRHAPLAPEPQAHLVRLLALGSGWWREIMQEGITVTEVARRHNADKSYVTRVIRTNFLAPTVVDQILAGAHPANLDAKRLLALTNLPLCWEDQHRELLFH